MSLDDWAVRNIEEAARKAFFGDYMKDKVDEALDTLFEDSNKEDELTPWFPLHPDQLLEMPSDDTNEAPGIGDS